MSLFVITLGHDCERPQLPTMSLVADAGCVAVAVRYSAEAWLGALPMTSLAVGIDCAAVVGFAYATTCLAELPNILGGDAGCVGGVAEGLGRAVA